MLSTRSLLPKLARDFPSLSFAPGERFAWSPSSQTVYYDTAKKGARHSALLLHELSHGLLGHHDYSKDVELLALESAAWDKAVILAASYGVEISDSVVQDNLDTYREWLHARSTCPDCHATGYQTGSRLYRCVACSRQWRVNEARLCSLRRYTI